MARRHAILIGVDGYSFRPLTSAVNDAIGMRDALVGRTTPSLPPIVADEDVTLLASPGPGETAAQATRPATRDAILGALRSHYDSPDPAEFLLVYFAGHGLVVSPDGRVRHTLVLPSDVTGPEDGRNMISLTELLTLFAERGPLQQVWIIDACRDMPYQRRPRGYDNDWAEQPPQGPRAQVAVFAVAQGGEALSDVGGQGRFTSHLLRGLAGAGSAMDYVAGRGHCVTAQSLHEYARRRVSEALEGFDDWTRTIQEPQITQTSRPLDPLRDLPPPPPQTFTVALRPPDAAPAVKVALEVQLGLPVSGWPPAAPPRVYELRAVLRPGMAAEGWGPPTPALRAVDLREQDSAIVDVPRRSDPANAVAAPPQPTTGERGVARARTVERDTAPVLRNTAPTGPAAARLRVVTSDSVAHVHLRRGEAPWDERDVPVNQVVDVAPGVWDVMIRIGDETISATRVVLNEGERRAVQAVAQITPATATLLPSTMADVAVAAAEVTAPALGSIQGAILPTLLPLLALKLFDAAHAVLAQIEHLHIPLLPADFIPDGGVPFAVAVAIDGPRPIDDSLPPTTAEVGHGRRLWVGRDGRVSLFAGSERDERATVTVVVDSRRMNIAAPPMRGGVTVVSVTSWRSGRFEASVSVFRLPPGTTWDQNRGTGAAEALARALALAAPLFRAGTNLEEVSDAVLVDIAYAKWLDPVLGAIAFHARDQRLAAEAGRLDRGFHEHLVAMRETIRRNLLEHFPELPDSRIIAALDPDEGVRRLALTALLDDADFPQPVLTASLAHLARAAADQRRDHWSIDRFARIVPGQVFNVVRVS